MRTRLSRREALILGLCACVALASGPGAADAAGLQPFRARYAVSYRGLSGGEIEQSLHRGSAPGEWVYESRPFPNLLGRVAVSAAARERGTMRVTAAGVEPLSYSFDDGSGDTSKDVRLTFDWASQRVRGTAAGQPVDLPLAPGTQDTASVQAAVLLDLLSGRALTAFPIVTGRRLREYRYSADGTARVAVPAGSYETVVWSNQRQGSNRVTRVWHAPAAGFVPVQAVQYRKGKAEVQLKLLALERP